MLSRRCCDPGLYIDVRILARPEELSSGENHISWKLIYLMAIVAYAGLALIYGGAQQLTTACGRRPVHARVPPIRVHPKTPRRQSEISPAVHSASTASRIRGAGVAARAAVGAQPTRTPLLCVTLARSF